MAIRKVEPPLMVTVSAQKLVSADDYPRLSLAVTLEREHVEKFADAERQIIDSIEPVPTTQGATARASSESQR